MPNFKFSKLKKPLLGAALLKTAPVLMGKGESGEEGEKSQLGVNHLILEETPGNGAIICTPKEAETVSICESASQWVPSDLIVAVNFFESELRSFSVCVRYLQKLKIIFCYWFTVRNYTERGYKLNFISDVKTKFLVRQETKFFEKTWFLKSSIYSRAEYNAISRDIDT
jgi:hypothetical protein